MSARALDSGAGAAGTASDIGAPLLSVVRTMSQVRVHEALCRKAGVELDRAGAALLHKLSATGGGLRLTDLAERLGIDAPAVTRKVQQLERAGLLARSADPGDARATLLSTTPEGSRSIERLLRARREWLAALLEGWSEGDREDLARLLRQLDETISAEVEARHGG